MLNIKHIKISKVLIIFIIFILTFPHNIWAINLNYNLITTPELYVALKELGVLFSNNEGRSWSEIGPNILTSDILVDNDYLFIATDEGIYRKFKSNNQWEFIGPAQESATFISKNNKYLLITQEKNIWLTSNPYGAKVNWFKAIIDLPNNNPIYSIRYFKQLSSESNYAYAFALVNVCYERPDFSIICTPRNIILGSNDYGYHWSILTEFGFYFLLSSCLTIDPNNPLIYAFAGYDGIRIMEWDHVLKSETRWAVADCEFIGENLVIGSFDAFNGERRGLQYTPDYGKNWYYTDLINKIVFKVAKNKVNNIVYVIAQREVNNQDLIFYKLDLPQIIESHEYSYPIDKTKEIVFSQYIP